jgi:signal transduction histidine kinase
MILARKTQLARVLVNLLSNAVQALEGQLNGKILVSLAKEEKYYSISIEDNGTGVPENLTHRLFKPNFTTKSGGTGLGLAICRSIIEQSQGSVSYRKSERLGGACFTIRLPFSLE